MRIEDREEYVDMVAQAVIDRIEERDRVAGLVERIAQRVLEIQEQRQAALASEPHDPLSAEGTEGSDDAGE